MMMQPKQHSGPPTRDTQEQERTGEFEAKGSAPPPQKPAPVDTGRDFSVLLYLGLM